MYDEFNKLKKVLLHDSFKFIIIEYGNYSVINEVKDFLASTFPQKKQIELSSEIETYNQFLKEIKDLNNGFVLINDFESYLNNENIYSGLNQKRDSFSQLKIALICFVHIASEEQVFKKCHINIPDLWEFRNLILKIEGKTTFQNNFVLERFSNNFSSLGGTSIDSKQKEIAEIEQKLQKLAETPENYPLIFNLYFQIVKILESLNRYEKALEYALKVKDIMEKISPPDHSELVTVYNYLGIIYKVIGELPKALEYALKAKYIIEKAPDNHFLALTYNNIGQIYHDMNDIQKSLEYTFKSKDIEEKLLDQETSFLSTVYSNIAIIYLDIYDLPKSLEYTLKSKDISEKSLDSNHPELVGLYTNLGTVYSYMGDLPKALEFTLKAKNLAEKVLNPNHPNLASVFITLGAIYYQMMQYKESHAYFKKAQQILESNFPKGHPNLDTANEWIKEVEKHLNPKSLSLPRRGQG